MKQLTADTLAIFEPAAYLYVELTCSMDTKDISDAVGSAFRSVAQFIADKGITRTGNALSVDNTYDPDKMTFRAGFLVPDEGARKAGGDMKINV